MRPAWKARSQNTLRFYRKRLDEKRELFTARRPLLDYFAPMIDGNPSVLIADLAAGPASVIGCSWPGVDVKVIASDRLAPEFNAALDAAGIAPAVPVEYQDMEALTYSDAAFDIVHCVNALDHTGDPMAAVREMVRVCKPGGWIYLRHIEDQGKKHGYRHLHQWNISTYLGTLCVIWKPGVIHYLEDVCRGWVTAMDGHVVTSTLRTAVDESRAARRLASLSGGSPDEAPIGQPYLQVT